MFFKLINNDKLNILQYYFIILDTFLYRPETRINNVEAT